MWLNMKTALQGRFSIPDSDSLHSEAKQIHGQDKPAAD